MSIKGGEEYKMITSDHKPSNEDEKKRIIKSGGEVYQTQTPLNNINNPGFESPNQKEEMKTDFNNDNNNINKDNKDSQNKVQINQILIGPYRVLPGRLSVSRTIGDAEAKLIQYGGNPQVIIPIPDVFVYDLQKEDIDFIILGCDGIYDQLSNEEILDSGWTIFLNEEIGKDINDKCGILVDFILKASMARKSFDNVTCVVIALKDITEMKRKKIINIRKIKNETVVNNNLIREEKNNLSNVSNIIKPSMPIIQKKSFNSISQMGHVYPKTNIFNNNVKDRGITLNIDSSQHLRNIQRIKIDKKIKNKKLNAPKKRIISGGYINNINNNNNYLGFKNIRKILNKSEINPQFEKDKNINKIDTDRIHLKRTFINKIPKYNLTSKNT